MLEMGLFFFRIGKIFSFYIFFQPLPYFRSQLTARGYDNSRDPALRGFPGDTGAPGSRVSPTRPGSDPPYAFAPESRAPQLQVLRPRVC